MDALVARRRKGAPRAVGELRQALDRVHFGGELGENRRLVAGARADVEHALVALERELLRDQRNDIGLRDGLAGSDRQRRVRVRGLAELLRDEQLARHLVHRREDTLVVNAARTELPLDPAAMQHGPRRPRSARAGGA